jgi:hypothetical protein
VDAIKSWIRQVIQPKRTEVPPVKPANRDFAGERETVRAGQMTAEDQTWEADTRQRDRAAHQRSQVEDWESEGGAGPDSAPRSQDRKR